MWNGVVTNAGLALLERWSEGSQTLNIEKATIGTGTVPQANLRVSTTVVGEVGPVSIVSSAAVTNGTSYRVQVGPSSTVPYIGHQIGIWASLEGVGVTTLLAIYQDEEGVSIPLSADAPGFLFTLYAIVTMSNEGSINVNYDGGAYVSRTDFADTMTVVNNNITTLQNKFPVSIANGGTGATTAANACANLGAVKKSGDTMTGNLYISESGGYPAVAFKSTDGTTLGGVIFGGNDRDVFIRTFNKTTGFRNDYHFPAKPSSDTENNTYVIATSIPGGEIAFAAGDQYREGATALSGVIRDSAKSIMLRVTVPKSLYAVTTASVTNLTGWIASSSGVIGNSGNDTNWLNMSGVTVRAVIKSTNTVMIVLDTTSVLDKAVNGVCSAFLSFTLSFS